MIELVLLTLMLFACGLTLAGAVTDLTHLKIPNVIPATIIGTFIIAFGLDYTLNDHSYFQSFTSHALTFLIVFVVMMGLFFANLFGGGDAKLIPAVALWVGGYGIPTFLMLTSIFGGVLAIIGLTLRKTTVGQQLLNKLTTLPYMGSGWFSALLKEESKVPYGIAIAIGTIGAFRHTGYLP